MDRTPWDENTATDFFGAKSPMQEGGVRHLTRQKLSDRRRERAWLRLKLFSHFKV
jgi:hypothetical protein